MIAALRKIAGRGSPSLAAVENLDLAALVDSLQQVLDNADAILEAAGDYENNDPADVSGRDEKDNARENRRDAWTLIAEQADELATALEHLAAQIT